MAKRLILLCACAAGVQLVFAIAAFALSCGSAAHAVFGMGIKRRTGGK
jgi:hypothetical protein